MKLFACTVLLTLAALVATPARASMIVNIGGQVVAGTLVGGTNYTDNEAGVDSNPAVGVMDIGTYLNGVSTNFVFFGFGAFSGAPTASLAMNSNANLDRAAVLPLSINVNITDTGFTNPGGLFDLNQTVNLLSSTGGITGNATAIGYFGASNTAFDVGGLNTGDAFGNIFHGIGTNTVATSATVNDPFPYSLTTAIQLEITARGTDAIQNLQLNANLSAVPTAELGSWMLILTGVVFMGLAKAKYLPKIS